MKYSTILFDLDGTLTDPAEGICKSVQYALQKAGRPVKALEAYHKFIGPPLATSFEVYEGATVAEAEELVSFYRERYSTIGLFENIPYAGMLELFQELKKNNATILIATGKPEAFASQILDKYGFSPYIDYLSGTPLTYKPIDKCDIIMNALYKMHLQADSSCIMIGDRSHDAIGAKMAHIDFCGVLYGYGSRDELEAEGATNLVSSVEELRKFLLCEN